MARTADRRCRPTLGCVLITLVAGLSACEQNGQSTLHPGGPAADRIADLWWLMLAAGGAVLLLVLVVLAGAFFHRGARAESHSDTDDHRPTRWILAGGVVLPVVVLVPLTVLTLHTLGGLTPPGSADAPEVVITGRQWWWDVQYSGEGEHQSLRTANELHIPVGRPVRIRLRSDDVIHSFWVPSLQGKLDLVPGKVNTTWIQADTAGVYRGICAEYCGLQHTRMQFRVVARPEAEFAEWRRQQSGPAASPADSTSRAGQAVFLRSGCPLCHAIGGSPARGTTGPDLTHLASRLTLAAGTLPNSKGHLAGWIANPQAIKPGNLMPRIPLRPDELQALVAYLSSLE